MLVKTSELTGVALDYAVAMCEDLPIKLDPMGFGKQSPGGYWVWPKEFPPKGGYLQIGKHYSPSKNWQQAGPIIERENISIIRCDDDYATDSKGYCTNERIQVWAASIGQNNLQYNSFYQDSDGQYEIVEDDCIYGPTPLIAAMRCYVASKLGEEMEIPEELL